MYSTQHILVKQAHYRYSNISFPDRVYYRTEKRIAQNYKIYKGHEHCCSNHPCLLAKDTCAEVIEHKWTHNETTNVSKHVNSPYSIATYLFQIGYIIIGSRHFVIM